MKPRGVVLEAPGGDWLVGRCLRCRGQFWISAGVAEWWRIRRAYRRHRRRGRCRP